ncbi:hypothetical protein PDJAM_G00034710 [Pangasius djambal]|uniref:Uncharacterized protein n=1 Tax=Pangasius djambal TaxID=1691987 RepID=A0ACC5YS37_9TELE|nr:hypothetical protein [Pangasius djambal]
MTRPGVQSAFQFIPKVFSGVEVGALCRTLEFFHTNLANHVFMDLTLCTEACDAHGTAVSRAIQRNTALCAESKLHCLGSCSLS